MLETFVGSYGWDVKSYILTTFLVGIETWKESPAKVILKSINATDNIKIRMISLLVGRYPSVPGYRLLPVATRYTNL